MDDNNMPPRSPVPPEMPLPPLSPSPAAPPSAYSVPPPPPPPTAPVPTPMIPAPFYATGDWGQMEPGQVGAVDVVGVGRRALALIIDALLWVPISLAFWTNHLPPAGARMFNLYYNLGSTAHSIYGVGLAASMGIWLIYMF